MLAQNVSAMNYAARRHADLSSPEAIKAYFNELFNLRSPDLLDKKHILSMIENGVSGCMLPFAQVAELFRLIEPYICRSALALSCADSCATGR